MTKYTLELEFDVNQITRSLQHDFTTEKKTKKKEKYGPLAGTANFEAGDDLAVLVTATGRAEDAVSVRVTDCTVVTIGTANLGKFFLSPFSPSSAVATVPSWGQTEITTTSKDKRAGRQRQSISSTSSFPILAPNGQWAFSGYLSVEITIDGKAYYRVFYFDPEGSTGNGGGWGFPEEP